jgi:hypothetical protein
MLPTERTKKKTDLRDFTIMVYGLPKIGKSTACARINDAIFIPTEPGHNSLEIFRTPQVESWKHFLEIAKELSTKKHEFKTIIIDLFDELYQHCANYFCEKKGVEHEGDIGFGKGISMIRMEVKRVISKLANLPTGLILVSHSSELQTETRTGAIKTRLRPSFSKCVWGKDASEAYHAEFVGMMDSLLFATMGVDSEGKTTRVIRSINTEGHEAGDRTGLFKDGMLLEDLFKTKGGK